MDTVDDRIRLSMSGGTSVVPSTRIALNRVIHSSALFRCGNAYQMMRNEIYALIDGVR